MSQSLRPQDALALGVCLRPPHAWSSTPAIGTQTLLLFAPAPAPVARHATWVADLVLERGASQRSPPLRPVQPLAHDTFTHPRAAAHSFRFHPGCDSSQAELPTTCFSLVWFVFFLHSF